MHYLRGMGSAGSKSNGQIIFVRAERKERHSSRSLGEFIVDGLGAKVSFQTVYFSI